LKNAPDVSLCVGFFHWLFIPGAAYNGMLHDRQLKL